MGFSFCSSFWFGWMDGGHPRKTMVASQGSLSGGLRCVKNKSEYRA